MTNGKAKNVAEGYEKQSPGNGHAAQLIHPAWSALVRFCQELQFGEIEMLKIQDGIPVLAEVTKKKVKFT
jgi:hypothetical protein